MLSGMIFHTADCVTLPITTSNIRFIHSWPDIPPPPPLAVTLCSSLSGSAKPLNLPHPAPHTPSKASPLLHVSSPSSHTQYQCQQLRLPPSHLVLLLEWQCKAVESAPPRPTHPFKGIPTSPCIFSVITHTVSMPAIATAPFPPCAPP